MGGGGEACSWGLQDRTREAKKKKRDAHKWWVAGTARRARERIFDSQDFKLLASDSQWIREGQSEAASGVKVFPNQTKSSRGDLFFLGRVAHPLVCTLEAPTIASGMWLLYLESHVKIIMTKRTSNGPDPRTRKETERKTFTESLHQVLPWGRWSFERGRRSRSPKDLWRGRTPAAAESGSPCCSYRDVCYTRWQSLTSAQSAWKQSFHVHQDAWKERAACFGLFISCGPLAVVCTATGSNDGREEPTLVFYCLSCWPGKFLSPGATNSGTVGGQSADIDLEPAPGVPRPACCG